MDGLPCGLQQCRMPRKMLDKQFYYSPASRQPGRLIYERTEAMISRYPQWRNSALRIGQSNTNSSSQGSRDILPNKTSLTRRKQIAKTMPVHIRNRRHNVEASIFQLSYHTTGGKTRYRLLLPQMGMVSQMDQSGKDSRIISPSQMKTLQ